MEQELRFNVIVSRVSEQAFGALKAAPSRMTLPDIPIPTTRATPAQIVAAVRWTLGLPHDDPWADIGPVDKTLDLPDKSFTGPF